MNIKLLHIIALFVCTLPRFVGAQSEKARDSNSKAAPIDAEDDDANAHLRAEKDWYESPFPPEYMKWLNRAAAREREHNGASLPAPGRNAPVLGTTWINLGPNKADFLKNGTTTLNKTDAGRVVAIVPDPTNADVLYVAMSGGGVWKTTNALSANQP